MSDASKTLNYDGIFVFMRGDRMDAVQILHKYDNRGEREKIVSLTGYAREIIRNNQTVTCIFPDTQEVMVEKAKADNFSSRLPQAIEVVADFYDFVMVGEERIAGRDAWIINISPKDSYRYGYRLWIDKDSKLLLKSELRDENQIPIERVMFTRLMVHESMDDALFEPSISGSGYTWYQYTQDTGNRGVANNVRQRWQATWLPAGFSQSDYDATGMSSGDIDVEHMIYSDGVATVSIFIEKLDQSDTSTMGPSKMGGMNVYAKVADGYQVTAVGEVPQATVKQMVDSVVVANR